MFIKITQLKRFNIMLRQIFVYLLTRRIFLSKKQWRIYLYAAWYKIEFILLFANLEFKHMSTSMSVNQVNSIEYKNSITSNQAHKIDT